MNYKTGNKLEAQEITHTIILAITLIFHLVEYLQLKVHTFIFIFILHFRLHVLKFYADDGLVYLESSREMFQF